MDQLQRAFNRLRQRRRKALIPFIMGGHPSLSATGPLLLALQEAGADVIEIGIPFSDPLADGPVIQAASAHALKRGVTPVDVFNAVRSVRHRLRVPVVCLTYWNPMLQFGGHGLNASPIPFLRAARTHGISGVVVPDVPVEEGGTLQKAAAREGLAAIFLAAPTSPAVRLRMIARASSGFIYYVSVTGTTGVRRELPPELGQGVRQLKLVTTKPVCVGFGVSTAAQAARVARISDGVIIGSALIRAIGTAGSQAAVVRRAIKFLKPIRAVV